MKIAYVDDCCHLKTKSTKFLINLLKKKHKVKCFWGTGTLSFPQDNLLEINKYSPDLIIFFQWMPVFSILKKFGCKKFVFIPMYDTKQLFSFKKSIRAKYFRVYLKINDIFVDMLYNPRFVTFCKKDYDKFSKRGDCIYIKYYPKAVKECVRDKPRLFFWERVEELSFSKITKLFDLSQFEKVYFMQRNDVGKDCKHYAAFNLPENIVVIDSWLERSKYVKILNKCNIAIAPRLKEGIGHGFLDYLSRGMCVLANDDATHNEYIINSKNGVLFDINNIKKIDLNNLDWKGLGKNARLSVFEGNKEWVKDQKKLLAWIEMN